MLIVFGFYGWGTSTISAITSIPFIFMNVSIFLTFFIFFAFGDRYSTVLRENLVIKSRQIYTVFGLLILLCIINLDWIFRSLTGDEVSYALQSQIQSYVLVKRFLTFFPQLDSLPFRLLIQIFSVVLLVLFLLTMRMMSKIKSTRLFVLLCFIGTLILRIATLSQGGSYGSNPPGASFYYLIGSTILSPTNLSYRIISLLLASLFLAILYEYLKRISQLPKYIRILILALIISIPIFRHMSLTVEISIWAFYFSSIILLQLYRSGGIASYQQVFLVSIATTFRFPLMAILVPIFVTNIFGTRRSRKNGDQNATYGPSILGVLMCLPGLILVSMTRLVERFGGTDLTTQQFGSQFREVGKTTREIFSTLSITTNKIAWLISVIGVVLFVRRSRVIALFLMAYLAIQYALYFVMNNADLAYASKYIIEWFGPLLVLGIIVLISSLEVKKTMGIFITASLTLLIISNVMDYNKIPNKFIKTSPAFRSGSIDVTGEVYRTLTSVPFPYGVAFDELSKQKEVSECLNVGIVYGVYPQIMAGYSGKDVLTSLEVAHKYLAAQEQIHESWVTGSAKSVDLAGSNCVIVGFVYGQASIVSDLLANNWRIQKKFTDDAYQTNVFIFTR
jgi:hypothetical protein